MNKQQALNTIVKALKKPDYMQSAREYRETVILVEHPFIPLADQHPQPALVEFCGFSSDDIYPFLYHLLGSYDPITGLAFWLCQQEDPRQHQVWAEARTEFTTYLVAGMTDYSGSGSHAYRELRNVFEFLAGLNGIRISECELEPGRDDVALAAIGKIATEQWAEVQEED